MIWRLVAALICCLPMLVGAGDFRLGRLFLTPAERASLDIVRKNSTPPETPVKIKEATGSMAGDDLQFQPDTSPGIVTVQGFVKRSDSKGTVWVNGRPVQEKNTTSDIQIGRLQGNTNDVQIKLPGSDQKIKLKAGQSYDPASGKVGSLREIAPHATPPALKELPSEKSPNVSGTSPRNGSVADKATAPPTAANPSLK